ncbi:MAG: DUF4163 domain-containing protein [Eubacteriales bacterium]|nr:DUF4163 domain-containing protein [Eubacteriales bacterium]
MKLFKVFAVVFCLMLIMPAVYAEVSVVIDDNRIAFDDQPPVVVNERVFVPLRKIFEELGAYVTWDADNNTIYAGRRFTNVVFTLNETKYSIDYNEKELDVAPFAQNNRTLVPLRAVSEALGADVMWSGEDSTVYISIPRGEHIIKDRYIEGTEFYEDGTPLLTYRVAYPEIEADEQYAQVFNGMCKDYADKYYKMAIDEALVEAKDEMAYEFPQLPYSVEASFDVKYDDYNIISVLFCFYQYNGGAHGNYYNQAITYNIETGEILDITDILSITKNEAQNMLYRFIEAECKKEPDRFYYDVNEGLYASLAEPKWYVAEDGLHIFFDPYEIAPFSEGTVDFVMPLE